MDEKTFGRAFDYIRDAIEKSRDFEGEAEIGLEEGEFVAHLHESKFKKFEGKSKARGAAIDGSSLKILDGHFFIIGSRRVGYVIADESGIMDQKVWNTDMEALSKYDAKEVFKEKYENLMQNPPPKTPESVEEANDAIRGLEEHAAARRQWRSLRRATL